MIDKTQDPADLESLAEAVHEAYLTTCARLGWEVKESNRVPYAALSEASKELDRASVRAVLARRRSPASPAPQGARKEKIEIGYAFSAQYIPGGGVSFDLLDDGGVTSKSITNEAAARLMRWLESWSPAPAPGADTREAVAMQMRLSAYENDMASPHTWEETSEFARVHWRGEADKVLALLAPVASPPAPAGTGICVCGNPAYPHLSGTGTPPAPAWKGLGDWLQRVQEVGKDLPAAPLAPDPLPAREGQDILLAALKSISLNSCCGPCQEAKKVATEALSMWFQEQSTPPESGAPAPTSPEFQVWWESHIARWGYKSDTEELVRDACAEAWAVARAPDPNLREAGYKFTEADARRWTGEKDLMKALASIFSSEYPDTNEGWAQMARFTVEYLKALGFTIRPIRSLDERSESVSVANGPIPSQIEPGEKDQDGSPKRVAGAGAPSEAEPRECEWYLEDEDAGLWKTGCGHEFVVNDGKPGEDEWKFCHCCAGLIFPTAYCPGCSEAGGADTPIYHKAPVCPAASRQEDGK